jgi:hypothetical protein
MKLSLILSSLLLFTSCGVTEGLQKNCGSDIEMGCNFVFGTKDADYKKDIDNLNKKNIEQDVRLDALEEQTDILVYNINNLQNDIDDNDNTSLIQSLQNTVNANVVQLLSLSSSIVTLNGNINGLQGQITTLDNALSKTIVDMIDPCGDGVGFDEIILKTKDGKYISYFEDGGKRFLSILNAGNYITTDRQACRFTITTNGQITF